MRPQEHFGHFKAIIERQGFIQGTLIVYVPAGVTKVTAGEVKYAGECLKHIMHLDQ